MTANLLLIFTAVLSAMAQNGDNKKATAPAPKTDTWARMKECSEQAGKALSEIRGGVAEESDDYPQNWENHYSPKYNRCYLLIYRTLFKTNSAGKREVSSWARLVDAFERSEIASEHYDNVLSDRQLEFCQIGDGIVACVKAKAFISEHMKN